MKYYLNDFLLQSKLQYELKNITSFNLPIKKDLIYERKIDDSKLGTLFSKIKLDPDFVYYSKQDLCKLFPINWKVRIKLLNSKKTGALCIFKIDFKNQNEILSTVKYLKETFKLSMTKDNMNELTIGLFERLNTFNSDAMFQELNEIDTFAMIFLDKNKFTLDSFNHQFIHYYQWMTGDAIQQINLDFNTLCFPENLQLFFIDPSAIFTIVNDIMNSHEFQTYGNIFINQIKKFLGSVTLEKARQFFKLYNKKKNETNNQYLKRIYKSELFQYIQKNRLNQLPLVVFMLNQIYKIHVLYFQQHLNCDLF